MNETIQWVSVALLIVTGIGIPVLIHHLRKQDDDRRERFKRLHERIDHLDECVDRVNGIVVGKAVTREDLNAMRIELMEVMRQQRSDIQQETNGLHARISRLENPYFEQRRRLETS
jgi:hypothetical protein